MTSKEKGRFVKTVRDYYETYGRHDLPWRGTANPYKIAVSEIMLQQTQVARVIEKYKEFLKAFPTVEALAKAPLQGVLLHWSGLGYNRRARFLHQMAKTIVHEKSGKFPKDFDELLKLPGIGHYTGGAIFAFAYNKSITIIETNIRTVFLYHFGTTLSTAKGTELLPIHDKELLPLIEATLDQEHPRQWYWALMDYGSYLKSQGIKIHRSSAQYKKQSTFKGSLREVRGGIIKILAKHTATVLQLQKTTGFDVSRIESAIETLVKEGIISKKGKQLGIS
jgi:A/G-specific adenine glycosylase